MSSSSKRIALFALPCDELAATPPPAAPSGALAQMPGVLWTTDTDLRFTMSAGSGLAQLGLRNDELPGKTLYDFFRTSDPAFSPITAHHAALVGLAHDFEFSHGGSVFHGLVEPLFDNDGKLLGTVATILDASNRRLEEEQRLRLARKAEGAEKHESLRLVARGIAHSFNNLLTAVIGYASLAVKELPAESPLLSYLQGIESSARQAADIAGKLAMYSGVNPLHEQPLNLSGLIETMGSLIESTVPAAMEVTYDLGPDLPFIYGDPDRLQRLLMVLLANACESLDEQPGSIHLRTELVKADRDFIDTMFPGEELAEGNYIWLQVSDSGSGMDGATQKRVFDPFFSTKFIGRGLGLSMAQGIVRAHHGIIRVASKTGMGTTVHVLFPVSERNITPLSGPHKATAEFQDAARPAGCPAVYYY